VKTKTLSRINSLLLVAIILVNLYLVLAPLAPMATFWIVNHSGAKTKQLHSKLTAATVPANSGNQLIVPSMGFDQPIFDGPDIRTLNKGVWRRPNTSTPDKGGNTVIVGHRFTYTNPRGAFYYLNKISVGDEIGIFWQGKKYIYKVSSVSQVSPTQLSVEANTPNPELTLYTCTPLWLPKDRLVIVAQLETTT
jgi:sortase A